MQDVARRILGEDVTQIDYYTERVKRMVGKVLTGNGITTYGSGVYSLIGASELSDAERDELQQLCRHRLRAQRVEGIYCSAEAFGYAHRSRHRTPISGSIKYRVLTRAVAVANAAARTSTSAPWRWITSSPETSPTSSR